MENYIQLKDKEKNNVYPKTYEKVLYDNATGTTSNITLSKTSANFNYIEIFYYSTYARTTHYSQKIYSPNGKNVCLIHEAVDAGDSRYWYNAQAMVSISGKNLSFIYNGGAQIGPGSTGQFSIANIIYITRVVGYYN